MVRRLREETDSPSFCFDSIYDFSSFSVHRPQAFQSWVARQSPYNIAECYKSGNLEVVVRETASSENLHLVFRAIPSGVGHKKISSNSEIFQFNPANKYRIRNNDSVFLGVSRLVNSVEEVVPSFVWLVRDYKFEDLLRDVSGGSFFSVGSFDLAPKGKFGFNIFAGWIRERTARISALVKSRPEVIDSIESNSGEEWRHRFSELELKDFVSSCRVYLSAKGVWVAGIECTDFRLKFSDASLGMIEAVPRAVKGVVHDDLS